MSKCCAQCECHCLKLNSKQMMRWRLSLSLSLSHTQAYTHTLRKHSHRNGDNRRNKGAFYVVCVLFRGAFYTHTHDILWYLNRRGRYIDSFDIKRFWYRKIWTRHTYALEFIYTDLNSMGTKSRQLWCCWRCGEWVTYNGLDIYIAIILLLEEDAHSSLHCKRATAAYVSLRPSLSHSLWWSLTECLRNSPTVSGSNIPSLTVSFSLCHKPGRTIYGMDTQWAVNRMAYIVGNTFECLLSVPRLPSEKTTSQHDRATARQRYGTLPISMWDRLSVSTWHESSCC